MGMSMVMTGIQAVAMPLIGESQFTREIESRLLAPSEGLRGMLAPQYPHIATGVVIAALAVIDVLVIVLRLAEQHRHSRVERARPLP